MKKSCIISCLLAGVLMIFQSCEDNENTFIVKPDPDVDYLSRMEARIEAQSPENYRDCREAAQYATVWVREARIGDTLYTCNPFYIDKYKPIAVTDTILRYRDGQNHATAYKRLYDPKHSVLFANAIYDENGMIKGAAPRFDRDTAFVFDNVKYIIDSEDPYVVKTVVLGRPRLPFHELFMCYDQYVNIRDMYYLIID